MNVHLHQDLGREVTDLRAEYGERIAGRGAARSDQQCVRRARLREQPDRAVRPVDVFARDHRRAVHRLCQCAGVGARDRGRIDRALNHVRERVVGGARLLRVVVLLEVLEHLARDDRVGITALELLQELAVVELAAAADAEDAGDQARHRDGVGGRPVRRHLLERRVLRGQHRAVLVGERVLDVLIDAVGVVLESLLRERAVDAVLVVEAVDLRLELVDAGHRAAVVAGRAVVVAIHREIARARPQELGHPAAPDVAQDVHQEQAVFGGDVAGGEDPIVAAGGIDVRHVEVGVANHDDARASARRVLAQHVAGGHAERGVLVVVGEGLRRERGRAGQQPVVHQQLVDRVRGIVRRVPRAARAGRIGCRRADERHLHFLRRAEHALLPRRQDVQDLAGPVIVVGPVRLHLRLRGGSAREREHDAERPEAPSAIAGSRADEQGERHPVSFAREPAIAGRAWRTAAQQISLGHRVIRPSNHCTDRFDRALSGEARKCQAEAQALAER